MSNSTILMDVLQTEDLSEESRTIPPQFLSGWFVRDNRKRGLILAGKSDPTRTKENTIRK